MSATRLSSTSTTTSTYRSAGWLAIASGLIGIITIVILFWGKGIWFAAQAERSLELFEVADL